MSNDDKDPIKQIRTAVDAMAVMQFTNDQYPNSDHRGKLRYQWGQLRQAVEAANEAMQKATMTTDEGREATGRKVAANKAVADFLEEHPLIVRFDDVLRAISHR